MQEWVFGCDICQEVCPWNRFASPTKETAFAPNESVLTMTKDEWLEITEEAFFDIYKNSPIKRAGYNGMKKNLGVTLPPGETPV